MTDKAKILLVDDEPGMLRYIRTLLEVEGHNVQTASTGEEAVDLVKKGSEALGGKGGGGRPDMAQAGGPDGAKANAALSAIEQAMAGA